MSSTSCVVSLKNGDECDSFHGIAAIREIDRQVASLKERVRARAGERVRGSESVVYTELIVLVLVLNSTSERKDVRCNI